MQAITEMVSKLFLSRRFNLIAFALIAGMILIAYSNTFTASFHFDDNPSIVEYASIKRVTMENIISIVKSARPVVYLSLMFNYALGGLNVVGYHVFNVSTHIATSFFVYLFVYWTLTLPVFKDRYNHATARRMALFTALIFAVHPIQTESVTYIITRTELLATFFYLASMLFFIKGVRDDKPCYYTGVFFAALFSMSSKEWAVTLPAMLVLYDYLFLSDKQVNKVLSHWGAFLLAALPWAVVSSNLNLMTNSGVGFNMSMSANIKTPVTYLLTSFNVLWTYIRLLIIPINQNLDYEYPVAHALFELPTLLSFIGHITVVGLMFWLHKRKGWTLIPFGAAWFYITISPVQSFVPVLDVIFEHRLYIPSIGFFLAFVVAYEGFFEWWDRRKLSVRNREA